MAHSGALYALVQEVGGGEDAAWLFDRLHIAAALRDWDGDMIPRASVAMALNLLLYRDLVRSVPAAQDYVAIALAEGRKITFDHGALRTIKFADGTAVDGHLAFDRFLVPLGYGVAANYPLPRLKMTGRAYCHLDHASEVPQFFVSELHVDQFSTAFADAAHRVFDSWTDPFDPATIRHLEFLAAENALPRTDATALLPILRAAFSRCHSVPTLADYDALHAESAEAAWIATEGNAFNHATDRVMNVDALAAQLQALSMPMKDTVEVSAKGSVRQTALRAVSVQRPFVDTDGQQIMRDVPGSFYEFITRDIDDETGQMDLGFDSGNATGIFAMTKR
jgi:Domain of unknown function (DUF1338)